MQDQKSVTGVPLRETGEAGTEGSQRELLLRRRRVVSIRLIISLVTASLIAVALLGFGNLAERNTRQTLNEEIEGRLILEARNLASLSVDALLSDFPELTLCPLVTEMQQDRQDLAFVAILDHDNKIKGHVDLTVLGEELQLAPDMKPHPAMHPLLPGEQVQANADVFLVSVPAQHANGRRLGTSIVGLRQSYIDEMVARPRRTFLILTIGLLIAGVSVTLLIMSILLRPIGALRAGLERIGQGDLATPIDLKDKTELGLLAETVDGMAGQLLKSQVLMLEKERLGTEMSLAHQMQNALLPEGEVRSGDFVCHGTYQAAAEVGGDYYDIIERQDGKLGLIIADVSGKGLTGCLVTSMLAVLIRSSHDQYSSPRDMLINLENNLMSSLVPGTFVTVFYGILDPQTGHLVFASAGHSPLAVYRAAQKKVEWFYTKGIPLGAMRNGVLAGTLQDFKLALEPGDHALQFTDGLNEAWSPQLEEQFDFDRIAEQLVRTASRGAQTVMEELLSTVESWTAPDPLGDDFTLLAIERSGAPVAPPNKIQTQSPDEIETASGRANLQAMLSDAMELKLNSRCDDLVCLGDWVDTCLKDESQLSDFKYLIESSLYEVCANIIEHGYDSEEGHEIGLWWVPLPKNNQHSHEFRESLNEVTNEGETPRDGVGYFVVCDQGKAFDYDSWTAPDLENAAVRRHGRGLGWQIIHSSMKKITYSPKTTAGNLTLLWFDPSIHETS